MLGTILCLPCFADKLHSVVCTSFLLPCRIPGRLLLFAVRTTALKQSRDTWLLLYFNTRGFDEYEITGTAAVAHAGFFLRSRAAATAKERRVSLRPAGGSFCRWGSSYRVVCVKSPQRPPKRGHAHTSSAAAAVEGDTRVVSLINDPLAFHGCVCEFSACCGRCVQRNRSSRQSVTDRRKSFSSSNSLIKKRHGPTEKSNDTKKSRETTDGNASEMIFSTTKF